MNKIIKKLKLGDMRTTGKSEEVVDEILKSPSLFPSLFEGLYSKDPGIRMRAADAIEKITSKRNELLKPYQKILINEISQIDQQEVQWHVAQLFSYLELSKKESAQIEEILFGWLENSKSNIVKVNSLETLVRLSKHNEVLKPKVVALLRELLKNSTPSLKARSRILLPLLINP